MATIYGIRNGELTTSKTCNREAVLNAIEADGFAWGVANAEGKLEVVNRSEELARKWRDERNQFYLDQARFAARDGRTYRWTPEGEDLQVVKVYAGKKAAQAAIAADAAEEAAYEDACEAAFEARCEAVSERRATTKEAKAAEVARANDDPARGIKAVSAGQWVYITGRPSGREEWLVVEKDGRFLAVAVHSTDTMDLGPVPHAESNAFLAEHGERVLREVAAESTALKALKGKVRFDYYPDARGSAARFVGYAAAEAALKALPELPEGWVAGCRLEGEHWIVTFEHAAVDDPRYLRGETGGSFPGLWKRPGGVEESITSSSHFG